MPRLWLAGYMLGLLFDPDNGGTTLLAITVWTTEISLFDSRQGQEICLFSTASRPALGPTQSRIQQVSGDVSPWAKQLGRETVHSPPSTA
jgi:hypothetical protein